MDRVIELNKRICSLVELLGGEGIPVALNRIDKNNTESDKSYECKNVATHPKELTKEAVKKWLECFRKKLKRKTSRDDLDRLILSLDRMNFEDNDCAHWEEVVFEHGKGKLSRTDRFTRGEIRAECEITSFQKMILSKNPGFEGLKIQRSELKEETGRWILDESFQLISAGGEAIVLKEKIGELDVAVRVQAFDPALFAEKEELDFKIHVSEDYKIAQNYEEYDARVIPSHKNVIRNNSNIEVFLRSDLEKEDCLGWITIMEKCDSDLRSKLKSGELNLEERKKIAMGVKEGRLYLEKIGIIHYDMKPENVLLKDGEPRWIDFSIIWEKTGRESYQEMGYARRGSRFRDINCLYAGSPAFSDGSQIGGDYGGCQSYTYIFILCEWKTAWTLLFKPIEEEDREIITKELESCNAEWLAARNEYGGIIPPSIEQVQNLSKIISLKNASSDFCLDDPNLTKSTVLANLKQKMTKVINFDFKNVTKNVLNQKGGNLCVPISISVLLRWAIKNDLKVEDDEMADCFTLEGIFTNLTMVIYPRSLAGYNLNPKFEEEIFQNNQIELLLKRLKFKSYLNKSGWEIIKEGTSIDSINYNFDFKQVLLHSKYTFTRPLSVTGAYLNPDSSIIFHQMVVDRIENSEFILQNSLIAHSGSQIRIPVSRGFYADNEMMEDCFKSYNDFVFYGPNKEFLSLVNEKFNMKTEKWYLLPQAYSITLTLK